jgi:hypothetical protein
MLAFGMEGYFQACYGCLDCNHGGMKRLKRLKSSTDQSIIILLEFVQ